jgi:ParB-like chromosome segregation protein Spo0J
VNGISSLQIDKVYPNPDQPRKDFDPDRLEELSMSIKE